MEKTKRIRLRAKYLKRLKFLRNAGAPLWVIRSDQIGLALARKGLKHTGLGRQASKTQGALYQKFVIPLMATPEDGQHNKQREI